MDKRTLHNIFNNAMFVEHSILKIGYDRKYEWRFWGYLDALLDSGMINGDVYLKIREHYRIYFIGLRRFINSRN